jgi:DNA-binding CsgD family transcriptional regulator
VALLNSVATALQQDRANPREAIERAKLLARYESLTPREREVLPLLVSGLLNKPAAFKLGITEYKVQIHRGHIMRKMEADSFATLVKLAAKLEIEAAEHLTGKRLRSGAPQKFTEVVNVRGAGVADDEVPEASFRPGLGIEGQLPAE